MRLKSWWGLSGVLAAVLTIAAAGVASGAITGTYKGHTSQKQAMSLKLSATTVRNFKIVVLDRCPDGHTLRVAAAYPPMPVAGGKFGGAFAPVGGRPGEKAILKGRVGIRKVSGSLKDTSFSQREGALCHGSTRFSAKHA